MTDSTVATYSKLTFDPDAYLRFVEDSDWTDEQKREFLEALWAVVVSFVDLGFGLHPIQQAIGRELLESDSPSVLALEDISDINNTTTADRSHERAGIESDS